MGDRTNRDPQQRKRIVVTGNDTEFLSGFIWYEDVQAIAAVPEPAGLAIFGAMGAILLRRRRAEPNQPFS